MESVPIALPAGWDAAKDCAYFEDRWEPIPSYTEALWGWMRFHYGNQVRALDMAVRYFRRHDAKLVNTDPSCLTPGEKIAILQEVAATSPRAAAYRPRLLEALAECAFAQTERARVVKEYRRAGEHAWMYPVIEVIDYLGGTAVVLDEVMTCENEDYQTFKARFDEDE